LTTFNYLLLLHSISNLQVVGIIFFNIQLFKVKLNTVQMLKKVS